MLSFGGADRHPVSSRAGRWRKIASHDAQKGIGAIDTRAAPFIGRGDFAVFAGDIDAADVENDASGGDATPVAGHSAAHATCQPCVAVAKG